MSLSGSPASPSERQPASSWFERLQSSSNPLASIGAVLAIVLVCLVASIILEPIIEPYPLMIFFPSMVVVGVVGGYWGGFVGLALAWPAALYFLQPAGSDWGFGDEGAGRVVRLLILFTVLVSIGVLLRRRELDRINLIRSEREARFQIERSERRLSTIAAASEKLAGALSIQDALDSVTESTTPALADWAIAALETGNAAPPQAAITATNASVRATLERELRDPETHLRSLLRNVRTMPDGNIPEDELQPTELVCEEIDSSLIAAPIIFDGAVNGAVILGMESPGRTFDGTDCRFVYDLARRLSASIANQRLVDAVQQELQERTRAEIAFRDSEARFRTLANAGSVLIRQEDERGDAMYFNQPWLGFTGKKLEELVGTRWLESVHPDDRAAVQHALGKAREDREPVSIEYQLQRNDGESRWMIERAAPRLSHLGEFTGIISSVIDISERKRAESNLQLLASTGAVITSSLDLDEMLIRFGNHATESFADWCIIHILRDGELRPIAIATARLEDRTHLIDLANRSVQCFNVSPITRQVLASHQPILVADHAGDQFAGLLRTSSSQEPAPVSGIVSWVMTPLEARGRIIGTVIFVALSGGRKMDETDLELARSLGRRVAVVVENAQLYADAQAAKDRYRRLFEGSADAILVIDQTDTLREANPALLHLLNARWDDVIDRPFAEILTMPAETVRDILSTAASGEWRGELRLRREEGPPVVVEAWLSRLTVPEGPIIVAAIRDISDRLQIEESRRRLLATVSHDLKNPLNSIKANAQLAMRQLKRGTVDPEKMANMFDRIDGLTNRMVAQIEDLMDVSLLESGSSLELHLAEVDLVAMTRLVVDQYQATTGHHRITVRATEQRVVGTWDAHRIERVLTNLLTNAIKYSPNGGKITFNIAVVPGDDGSPWAKLSLSDEGIGIQAEDLPNLFMRFGRGRNVTERISGTGIGLVGVRQIVQQHGGSISVESTEGEGSTFTILLPLTAHADAAEPATP